MEHLAVRLESEEVSEDERGEGDASWVIIYAAGSDDSNDLEEDSSVPDSEIDEDGSTPSMSDSHPSPEDSEAGDSDNRAQPIPE